MRSCPTRRLSLLAGLLLISTHASLAAALSRPVVPHLAFPDEPVPADGALLLTDGEVELVSVLVLDEAGAEVPGTVTVVVEGFSAWRPQVPLMPGQRYTVELGTERFGSEIFGFSAEAPWLPWLPAPSSTSQVVIDESTQTLCCSTLATPVQQTCFDRSLTRSARADLRLQSDAPRWQQHQFVYQIEGQSTWDAYLPYRRVAVTMEGERPCYQVRARHITLLTDTLWPEVCLDVGPLPELGTEEYPIDDHLAADVCEVPPRYYEDEWCAVNEDACQGRDDAVCLQHAELCRGFSLTVHDDSGAGSETPTSPEGAGAGGAPAGPNGAGGASAGGPEDGGAMPTVEDAEDTTPAEARASGTSETAATREPAMAPQTGSSRSAKGCDVVSAGNSAGGDSDPSQAALAWVVCLAGWVALRRRGGWVALRRRARQPREAA